MHFQRGFKHVPGLGFHGSASLFESFVLVTFWWSLAPAKTVLPPVRKLCFERFEASATDIFMASLFVPLFGDDLNDFGMSLE